jgi:hypothetical protein
MSINNIVTLLRERLATERGDRVLRALLVGSTALLILPVGDSVVCLSFASCRHFGDQCLCGLVVRVPGYTTEMYCVSCEVRTEFIYVM